MSMALSLYDQKYQFHSPSDDLLVRTLSSCENLATYLEGHSDIEYLAAQGKVRPTSPTDLAYDRWAVTWLKSNVFHYVSQAFNYYKPSLSYYFPNATKTLQLTIHRALSNSKTPAFAKLYEGALIVRTLNLQPPEQTDFYLHPPIRLYVYEFKEGERVGGTSQSINFFPEDGVCMGICHWLLFLFFKTSVHYSDPKIHLQAVAKLFENGAPREATLLQFLQHGATPICERVLGLKAEGLPAFSPNLTNLNVQTLAENRTAALEYLKNIPLGAYRLTLTSIYDAHSLCYFKMSEKVGFLFDPNVGLIELAIQNQQGDLIEKLLLSARLMRMEDEDEFKFELVAPHDGTQSNTQYRMRVETN